MFMKHPPSPFRNRFLLPYVLPVVLFLSGCGGGQEASSISIVRGYNVGGGETLGNIVDQTMVTMYNRKAAWSSQHAEGSRWIVRAVDEAHPDGEGAKWEADVNTGTVRPLNRTASNFMGK